MVRHIGQQNVMMQRMATSSLKTGQKIDKQVVVMDLKNVPLSHHSDVRKLVKLIAEWDQDFYPESLGMVFVINVPSFFTVLWAIVKPWLDPVVVHKFRILGTNFLPTMTQFIDEEQIPEEYGGKNKTFSWKLPDSYVD